ncbi:MAG: hypothetical protein ACKVU4_14335 [Phycisphaerales bacterium]
MRAKPDRPMTVPSFVRRAARRAARGRRRGVVSVVSMMFLILFGSLAAAMAILSKGNIITAATHQHVTRALGAAETGLGIAEARLVEAVRRFAVAKGEVDAAFGQRIWTGAFVSGDGALPALPPTTFSNMLGTPAGAAEALAQAHAQDANVIVITGHVAAPTLGPAPTGTNATVYALDNWLRTPIVGLADQISNPGGGTAFQVDYAPLANGTDIRVIVTGYDFDYGTDERPVTRRIMEDFRLIKRVDAAVVSPSRIMIGKNVSVEGDLGAVFEDVAAEYGDPLVLKSDFYGIDTVLDGALDKLYTGIAAYDVDQDNRLRTAHPTESTGIPDLDGNGSPDGSALDLTGDGMVDDFDLFIRRYDTNTDGVVALSDALRAGTPNALLTPEFVGAGGATVDEDLGWLIDSSVPDRNNNGDSTFVDNNGDGRFQPGIDALNDIEPATSTTIAAGLGNYLRPGPPYEHVWADQALGYRDGIIDRRDQYAKVQGKLRFRVDSAAWTAGQGSYMARLQGAINPGEGASAVEFQVSNTAMPELTPDSFNTAESTLKSAADGDPFADQVAANLGISTTQLATWTPAMNNPAAGAARYYPVSPDANGDGLPDNWSTAYFEKTPFNSPNFSDWYYRPVYENMEFKDVQVPQGTNALFNNCTFAGVTYVRSWIQNTHVNWTIYGKLKLDPGTGKPVLDPPRFIYGDQAGENSYPPMLPPTAIPPQQMILMAVTPLDKGDIPAAQIPLTVGYDSLPEPLVISGKRVVDTKAWSNNLRFHSCLFVGSIVSDSPVGYTHVRNKMQFTGATKFVEAHPTQPSNPDLNPEAADLPEIRKSSLMLPQYSVDLGAFNSPPSQDIQLRGAIVAGVLDIRGNAEINGALLMTFKPVLGEGPLQDPLGNPAGNAALFNTTIGYFGPDEGDDESLDPRTLPIITIGGVPTKIVGYDTNGDGLPDVGPQGPAPVGSVPVPFYGYGAIKLRFDRDLIMPDGMVIPLQIDVQRITYREASK